MPPTRVHHRMDVAARAGRRRRVRARCVGISWFAFCTACGQSRTLLRSSSGAKSRLREPRAGFEADDVEAGLRERQRGHAAGGAEADDDDVGVLAA